MLKVHVHESLGSPVKAALMQVLNTLLNPERFQLVDSFNEANTVIVQGLRVLEQLHSLDRRFLLVTGFGEKPPAQVAENVAVLKQPIMLVQVIKALGSIEAPVTAASSPEHRPDLKRVLVIEDSARHVAAAQKQLSADFNLTVVTNYQQALKAVQQPYDAVLTDLMLPATSETLGTEAIEKYVGQEMPLGFVLVFLASLAGTPRIGVLTDLNHHAHPVSASLDHLRNQQIVNGALVVFSNTAMTSDGKDWRSVLEALLKE